jgi:hypothetical protein
MRALLLLLAGCTSEIAPRYVHLSDRPSQLSGMVVDAEGRAAGPFVMTDGHVSWDHEGLFSFPVVPGDYSLHALSENTEAEVRISIEPGEELDGLVLDLHPRVADDDDAPTAGENEDAADYQARPDEPDDGWTPPLRSVAVRNLDEEGRPIVSTWMEVMSATPHEGSCLSGVGRDQIDLDGEALLRLPDLPTTVELEIPGYLPESIEVAPERKQLTAHHRRGVELMATIRDAPEGVEVHCGPSTKFVDEHHRVRITCPAGLSRVEIESDPPRAFSLSGEAGRHFYGVIQL